MTKLAPQAWMTMAETERLMRALTSDGGDARFVGGCVRNALANRKVIDIDIATPLTPDAVIERLKQNKIGYAPTGLKHGTVTAVVDGFPFEITTLRHDIATDGRHAQVAFTDDWQADAARRDFTINAMYATVEGDVFDPFGGVEDLRRGCVRFVGDAEARIHEDYLRILRYFRFYAHFGHGVPDEVSLKAAIRNAGEIRNLSGERVRQETLKLMESDRAADVWQVMMDAGVIAHFLPEAKNIAALGQLIALENLHECPAYPLRRLAALMDVTPAKIDDIAGRLKLSNDQAEQLAQMATPHKDAWVNVKRLVYKIGNEMARNFLLLHAARTGTASRIADYDVATEFNPPRFPLSGEDVLALGYKPGREVGVLLARVENWWLDEGFKPDRDACLQKLQAEKGLL